MCVVCGSDDDKFVEIDEWSALSVLKCAGKRVKACSKNGVRKFHKLHLLWSCACVWVWSVAELKSGRVDRSTLCVLGRGERCVEFLFSKNLTVRFDNVKLYRSRGAL